MSIERMKRARRRSRNPMAHEGSSASPEKVPAVEREQLQATRLELAVFRMLSGQSGAEQRLDASADMLEGPGVEPDRILVERDQAIAHDQKVGAEQ